MFTWNRHQGAGMKSNETEPGKKRKSGAGLGVDEMWKIVYSMQCSAPGIALFRVAGIFIPWTVKHMRTARPYPTNS